MAKEKHVEGEEDHYIKTLIGAVLGYAADGLDMFLLSFILVFIIKDFGLTTAEAGNLTLATTIGMWIGSYIFGLLADKYGRTKILSFSIILFAVSHILDVFVDNYTVLLVLRFIIGSWLSVVNLVLVWRLLLKHGHLICEQELLHG